MEALGSLQKVIAYIALQSSAPTHLNPMTLVPAAAGYLAAQLDTFLNDRVAFPLPCEGNPRR